MTGDHQHNFGNLGVSLLICTYNGSKVIVKNLECIKKQVKTDGITWELIVVDNASKDDTKETVLRTWGETKIPFRFLYEPKPGKDNALRLGFREAQYEIVCIIDDDTRMCEDYVFQVYHIMKNNPEVGICGAHGIGEFEKPPPGWLSGFENALALGPQASKAGILGEDELYLYGACSAFRKSLWEHLHANGFNFFLSGRTGKSKISSGEDLEVSLAATLSGYKLWYEPKLTFYHYMPANRLNWNYFRRLYRSFGRADVIANQYLLSVNMLKGKKSKFYNNYILALIYDFLITIRKLPGYIRGVIFKNEGNAVVLDFERHFSHFQQLLSDRKTYLTIRKSLKNANWIKIRR